MRFNGTILYVPDVAASMAFYQEAFGFQRRFLTEDASYGDLATGGPVLGFASLEQAARNWESGVAPTDPSVSPPAFEVGLETEDVHGAWEAAIAAGAKPLAPPETKPWGQIVAFLRDPDGHVVELATPWEPPEP